LFSDDILKDPNFQKKLNNMFELLQTFNEYIFEITFTCIFNKNTFDLFNLCVDKFFKFSSSYGSPALKIRDELNLQISSLEEELVSMQEKLALQKKEKAVILEIKKKKAFLEKTVQDYLIINKYVNDFLMLSEMILFVPQFCKDIAICKICKKILYNRTLNPVKIVECNHRFHIDCLTKNWCIKDENTLDKCKCPICEKEFNCNRDTLNLETYFNDLKRQEEERQNEYEDEDEYEDENEKAGGKRSNSSKRSRGKRSRGKRSLRKTRKLRSKKLRKTKRNFV
jgi:hypothetical protein